MSDPEQDRSMQIQGENSVIVDSTDGVNNLSSPTPDHAWSLQYVSPEAKIDLDKQVDRLTTAAILTCGLTDPDFIEKIRDTKRSRVYREYRPYGFHSFFAAELEKS
jgi:hypothetical protein